MMEKVYYNIKPQDIENNGNIVFIRKNIIQEENGLWSAEEESLSVEQYEIYKKQYDTVDNIFNNIEDDIDISLYPHAKYLNDAMKSYINQQILISLKDIFTSTNNDLLLRVLSELKSEYKLSNNLLKSLYDNNLISNDILNLYL